MAANEDKNSLQCSNKNLSFEVTFRFSATKQLVSSTCYKLNVFRYTTRNANKMLICKRSIPHGTKWASQWLGQSTSNVKGLNEVLVSVFAMIWLLYRAKWCWWSM